MPSHEPTLIAAARSHMTASSPRGTFSQAELAAERVITRLGGLHLTGVDLRPILQNPQVRPMLGPAGAPSDGRALTCAAPVKWRPRTRFIIPPATERAWAGGVRGMTLRSARI
jgi:hypothetical protein